MQPDLEYWIDEANTVTVEPKTVKGREIMVQEFPIYGVAKLYKAYLANNGALRWEFPELSTIWQTFLRSQHCSASQVVRS